MNGSNKHFDPHNRFKAKLVSLAEQGQHKVKGVAPSEEELAMLFDGQLDFKRKDEVMSHINTNPVLLKQWLQLVDIAATEETNTEKVKQTAGLFLWFTHWQRIVSGMAVAGIATVLILNQTQNGLSPEVDTQTPVAAQQTKGGQPNNQTTHFISPDTRAIAAGVQSALNKSTIKLPYTLNLESAMDAKGSALVESLYIGYFQLGQTSAKIALHCQANQPIPAAHLKTFASIKSMLKTNSFISLSEPLKRINIEAEPSVLCAQIKTFLVSTL